MFARWTGVCACLLLLAAAVSWADERPQLETTRSPHGALNIPCENCHTFTSWKPLRSAPEFDHNNTRYPLRGMHVGVACNQCHVKLVFTNVGTKCADCHADIHRGQFGARCEDCHTVKGWKVNLKAIQDHENRFPLVGAHATLLCEDCHTGAATGQFTGLSTQCVACHLQTFNATTLPSHAAVHFPSTCEVCHNMDSWQGASFDHLKFTGFALTGVHATLSCSACHGNGFQALGASCINCHLKDFNGTTNPNHAQAGFPQDCGICHNTSNWTQITFNHNTFTSFPLTGAHVSVPCVQCHVNGQFAGTPKNCVACHLKDFNGTTNPNHVKAGFSEDCAICHSTVSWSNVTFNHNLTGFPLTGAHTSLACASCHINNNFNLTSSACVTCHLKDYNGTTNPNHAQAGFPQDCAVCHNTASWSNASFNHSATGFSLTGAHASLACAACHVNGNYKLTSGACVNCHLKDYNSTTNPNHAQAGFPTDCSICHSTTSWSNANFNHATTGFALTGAHTSLACASCHVNNNYNLTSSACVTCHLKDYNGTTNPNHIQAGFPQQCDVCHSTTAWIPATFNHNNTGFPLTGAHATVPCNSCHIGGKFAGTPTDCYSCHKSDYQGTTDPNHVAANFPTDCSLCHNTTSWSGAVFNHTWFPIYSGTHAGVWTSCSTCHINSSNYAQFSCITCHTHSQANTDPNHTDVGGYVYSATSCYTCHPTGQGGG